MNLLVISNLELDESSGSGYVILGFCSRIRELGHQVDLFGPEHYEPGRSLRRASVHRKALGMLYCALRQLSLKRYDIVEFYGAESWLAAWLLSAVPGRSFLTVSHSNGLESHVAQVMVDRTGSYSLDGSPPTWFQKRVEPLLEKAFTRVDAIVTVSDFDRDFALARAYQPASRILAIDNSLPPDFLSLDIDLEREPVIGFCGSWLIRKGVEILKPAIIRILTEFPGTTFKTIGSGDQFELACFPSQLRDRIEVLPYTKDRALLRAFYQEVSIAVMPSFYESFGLAAAEAMACGCALVSTRVGLPYKLENKKECILIEPDETSLTEGIKSLLTNEKLRQDIACAGYARVQCLRWQEAVNKLLSHYKQWLSEIRTPDKASDGTPTL